MKTVLLPIWLLLSAAAPAAPVLDGPLEKGLSHVRFSGWTGPQIPVWVYLPWRSEAATAPILFVMHGNSRDPARYVAEWDDLAEQHGLVIIAPEFSREAFPGSLRYNLGYLFDEGSGAERRAEATWSFSALEPLFDAVVAALGSNQTHYTLYGHSAGSQFVHRYHFLKPDARVRRVLAANAGWYTLADLNEPWPYGLGGAGVSRDQLKKALAAEVVVLLGTADNDPQHKSLRRTPEALAQGAHRFARGQHFFATARDRATALGVPFGWKLVEVPDVAHSNRGMAAAAARRVR
ncbi:MAG: alpha/beta hydrolase [Pseudomonadota bacterium]